MITNLNMHEVLSIKLSLHLHDGFHVHSWVITGKGGQVVTIQAFHDLRDSMVIHAYETHDFRTKTEEEQQPCE